MEDIKLYTCCFFGHRKITETDKLKSNLYSEIEKFCVRGYSTKGMNRGMGLTRVKEIVMRINATLMICNKEYIDDNYLCFEVIFS